MLVLYAQVYVHIDINMSPICHRGRFADSLRTVRKRDGEPSANVATTILWNKLYLFLFLIIFGHFKMRFFLLIDSSNSNI